MAFGIREPAELLLGCVTWGVFLTSVPAIPSSKAGTSAAESSGCQWCRKGPHGGVSWWWGCCWVHGRQVQQRILWARPPQKVPGPVLQPARGSSPGSFCREASLLPSLSSLCSGPCLSNFGFPGMLPRRSEAGLAASFPLGRAGSPGDGRPALPRVEKVCVC